MKKYVSAADSDYIRIGNLTLPTDASGYGYESAEEISRDTERKIAEEEARKAAEAKRQREAELGSVNYEKAFGDMDLSGTGEDQLTHIFEALVPPSGTCDNLGAELVRAMMRVLYRDWNDGDVFYEGYGLETCSSDMAFVADKVEDDDEIWEMVMDIAESGLEDDAYTAALGKIVDKLLDYLREHPEVFGQETEDCRSYKSDTVEELADRAPKYEFDVDVSGDLERYIDNGCIDWDDVYYWLDGLCSEFGGELNQRALDWFEIDELDKEQLRYWEDRFYDCLSGWLDDLENEFPNYGEKDEDEYYEDDEDDEDEEE